MAQMVRSDVLEAMAELHIQFSDPEPQHFLDQLIATLQGLTGSAYAVLGQIEEEDNGERAFQPLATGGGDTLSLVAAFGEALTAEALVIDNAPADAEGESTVLELDNLLAVPLHVGDEVVALVGLANRPGGMDMALLDTLQPCLVAAAHLLWARQLRDQLAEVRKQGDDDVAFLTHHDPLTGLANRHLFVDRVQQALARQARNHTRIALMLVDMDHFHEINDKHGDEIADKVLHEVAVRLRRTVRRTDTLARFSGDDFVVLLEEIGTQLDALSLAGKVIDHLNEPIVIDALTIQITASIGIAITERTDGDSRELLREATQALHQAQALGGNTYHLNV